MRSCYVAQPGLKLCDPPASWWFMPSQHKIISNLAMKHLIGPVINPLHTVEDHSNYSLIQDAPKVI